jgi:hypothetical protein
MTEQNALEVRRTEPELTAYETIERVIASGDIGKMDPQSRVAFYWRVCTSMGLNPMTQPFSYLNLDGKVVLYARKDATEQLRRVNGVSVTSLTRERDDEAGIYTVTAHGRLPDGREDEASGVVAIKGLSGMALANSLMKAETKAKRRLTLSLVGLGFLDESEVEGIGETINVDPATGEILSRSKPASLLEAVQRQAEVLATPSGPAEAAVSVSPSEPPASVEPEVVLAGVTVISADGSTTGDLMSDDSIRVEPESFFTMPMTPEASAHVGDEEEPDVDDEVLLAALAPHTLTVAALADLARAGGLGKMAFASAIDCVPADVGKRIEGMTDAQRYDLARSMGMLGAS